MHCTALHFTKLYITTVYTSQYVTAYSISGCICYTHTHTHTHTHAALYLHILATRGGEVGLVDAHTRVLALLHLALDERPEVREE